MWISVLGIYALYKYVMRVVEAVRWRLYPALLHFYLQKWSALTFRPSSHIVKLEDESRLKEETQTEPHEASIMKHVC